MVGYPSVIPEFEYSRLSLYFPGKINHKLFHFPNVHFMRFAGQCLMLFSFAITLIIKRMHKANGKKLCFSTINLLLSISGIKFDNLS